MKKFGYVMSLLISAAFVLGACVPAPSPAEVAGEKISQGLKTAYLQMARLNTEAVPQETGINTTYGNWQESYSNFVTSAGESTRQIEGCWSNSEDLIVAGANAVFGADAGGNPVSAADEKQAFINALASGGGLYAGDAAKCQQAVSDFIDWARANRTQLLNMRFDIRQRLNSYINWQNQNLSQRVALSFINTYGPTFEQMVADGSIKALDALALNNDPAHPLQPLEWDFVGFPTGALQIQIRSQRLCQQNLDYYNGAKPTPDGTDPRFFKTTWIDQASGDCTLYRRAAWNYMARLFISAEAAARENCGVDAGFDQQVDPNTCQVVTPTPIATQVPASP